MNPYPENATAENLRLVPRTAANAARHLNAVRDSDPHEKASDPNPLHFERGLLHMIRGLACYAGAHARQYESPIADDGVIGEAWLDALKGVRALLNGELGRLDGGALDHAIVELHKAAGFEGEL